MHRSLEVRPTQAGLYRVPRSNEGLSNLKLILKTFNNEELRFFAADEIDPTIGDDCRSLVIRHSAPLVSCIYFAEGRGLSYWTIIC